MNINKLAEKAKKKKIVIVLVLLVVFSLIGVLFFLSKNTNTNTNDNKNKGTQNEDLNSQNNSTNQGENDAKSTSNNKQPSEPRITLDSPVANEIVSTKRAISGKYSSVNGSIYYEVSGEEAGVIAEGTIVVEQNNEAEKAFSGEISYNKKPIEGDIGTFKMGVIINGSKKELISVKVGF